MKEFFGQEAEFLIIGAVTGIGVLVRLLLFCYYIGLGRACRAPERTKNKTMAYIRKDLKQRGDNGEKIKNVALYTECRLTERRIGGIRLGVLECVWQQSLLMVPLCGVLAAFAALFRRAELGKVFFLMFISGVVLFGLLALDLFGGIKEKSKRVRLCIREYIEDGRINCWVKDVVVESSGNERKEAKREKKEKRSERKREKKEKKEAYSAEKKCRKEEKKSVRKTNRGKGKAQEEKRRLTEELLRERRQLEARSLAEQRRRDREEENAEYRAEAAAAVTECTEPAVTECAEPVVTESAEPAVAECAEPVVQEEEPLFQASSYEDLLNDVLAEYLV